MKDSFYMSRVNEKTNKDQHRSDKQNPIEPNGLLEAALEYVRRGWPVFPLYTVTDQGCSCGDPKCSSPGKHPRTANGHKEGANDENLIRQWWKECPDANIGIRTGEASGIVVLDIDPGHKGDESLACLEQKHGPLPKTLEQKTGGGGRHILFKHPGVKVRCRVGLASGLDVRGDEGYIVAPPSVHKSGDEYEWVHNPIETSLAPMPSWLLELVNNNHQQSQRSTPTVEGTISEGSRNTTLTSLAGSMRRKGMTEQGIKAALLEENSQRCDPPLDKREVERIAKNVARYEPEPQQGVEEDQKVKDIRHEIEQISTDTDKTELVKLLEPVLKRLARLDEATSEAYLSEEIKPRFGLKGEAIKAYRTLLKRYRAEAEASAKKSSQSDGSKVPYSCTKTGLWWHKGTKQGIVLVQLANFGARICTDLIEDDGAETRHSFEIEAKINGKNFRFTIPAIHFSGMNWVTDNLGAGAVVRAGFGTKDRAREAIQLLSGDIDERRAFTHTGWRKLDNQWVYLHAGGAIGPIGPIPEVGVQLEGTLARYHLPEPPSDEEQVKAIQSSLQFLDSAPDRVTVPLYGGIWRVVLGNVDFSEHIAGPTGKGKSEEAALAQQHFGLQMDGRNLPANWTSTDNALEGLAFLAKDAVLVIDDFAPAGTSFEIAKLHQKADRVMRSQGNRTGRQRMRSDITLRPERPPRGLIVSTGEDVPRGKSLRARMFVIEVSPGDVDWEKLTTCQEDAANGVYAQAMAGFIQWLAPRYESIRKQLQEEIRILRKEATQSGMHKRTPDIVANLAVGLRYFLEFAQEVGAITEEERQALWQRIWKALGEVASAQKAHLAASDPVERFLELVRAAIASGKAHVAGPDGQTPENPEGWGWRYEYDRDNSQGNRIGWIDGDNLYLEPEASYGVAQRLARDGGEPLSVGSKTLHKRLDERSLLASKEKGRLVVRKTLEGERRHVLHLNKSTLFPSKPDQSDQSDQKEAQNIDR